MSLKRIGANVALGLFLLIAAAPALGQGLRGLQLFDTPDLSTYGGGGKANEGFFISYDGLYWNVSPAKVSVVGKEGLHRDVYYGPHPIPDVPDTQDDTATQYNSLDTSRLTGQEGAHWVGGQRIEVGRMVDGHGWLLSFTELQTQTVNLTTEDETFVPEDPGSGPHARPSIQGVVGTIPNPDPDLPDIEIIQNLPITFQTVNMINSANYWSIELMYAGRSEQMAHGGYFEWFAGPRYTEFNDEFLVNAIGGSLDATRWATDAQNHIIAGQVGARYFKKVGRWMFNTEGRFFAGLNYQNIHQFGVIASNSNPPGGLFEPLTLGPVGINHTEYEREFVPGIELRLEMRYQMTRAISFRAGWSGTWMDNIARASNMVDYTLPSFGILPENNRQSVIVNGAVIGIDINR